MLHSQTAEQLQLSAGSSANKEAASIAMTCKQQQPPLAFKHSQDSVTRNRRVLPNATQRLRQLFAGSAACACIDANGSAANVSVASAQPHARGYAALNTETLKALCRARGLPTQRDRQELLQQIQAPVSLHPKVTAALCPHRVAPRSGAQQQHRKASRCSRRTHTATTAAQPMQMADTARIGAMLHRDSAGGIGGPVSGRPADSVAKVVEEAARLAQEVADVQRQFRESKRAVDVRASEAAALLDDISKVGRQEVCVVEPDTQTKRARQA